MLRKLLLILISSFTFGTLEAAPQILGGERPAKLYLPVASSPTHAVPLILFLHGYTVKGSQLNIQFKAATSSNKLGYAALIPDGQPDARGNNFWNATPECCNFYGSERDDVSYLVNLIDEAKKTAPISEVILFGHSNGGFMANRLACERPDLFKGIVSVAGGLYRDKALCKNPGDTKVLQVHGTADRTIPYASNANYSGAKETVENWASLLGCTERTETAAGKNLITFGFGLPRGNETDVTDYRGCRGNAKVSLWTINGGSHVNIFNNLVAEAIRFMEAD